MVECRNLRPAVVRPESDSTRRRHSNLGPRSSKSNPFLLLKNRAITQSQKVTERQQVANLL